MIRIHILLAALLTFAIVASARPAYACPNCSDAIMNAAQEESEKDNTPAAFNQSIYLMVGMPYLAFGVLGFMVYRGAQKNAEYLAKVRGETPKEG